MEIWISMQYSTWYSNLLELCIVPVCTVNSEICTYCENSICTPFKANSLLFLLAEKVLFAEKFFLSWYHFKAFICSFKTSAIPRLRKYHLNKKHCLFIKYSYSCYGSLNHQENSREAEFGYCCGTDDLCLYASFSNALLSDIDRHKVFYMQYDWRLGKETILVSFSDRWGII